MGQVSECGTRVIAMLACDACCINVTRIVVISIVQLAVSMQPIRARSENVMGNVCWVLQCGETVVEVLVM